MANGDISQSDIQNFLEFGEILTSDLQTKVDAICTDINADVNLILQRLGFLLPVTDTNSLAWLGLTKKFGAASLTIDLLNAQDTEEENTRATRYWDKYLSRIEELLSSGGDILNADFQADPRPTNVPISIFASQAASEKKAMRLPQLAAAERYDDEAVLRRSKRYSRVIRGF